MSKLYKLGDGPINYDWNKRYCTIEATELIYSQSQNDMEQKTINIQGAAISNICKIKGKNFCFCISIPPPLNKIIYLAADNYQECAKFREKCLKATQNNIYDDNEPIENYEENEIFNEKSQNQSEKIKSSGIENPFKNKPIPEEIIKNLDTLKNEILLDDSKFKQTYKNGIKVCVPVDIAYYNFINFILKNLLFIVLGYFFIKLLSFTFNLYYLEYVMMISFLYYFFKKLKQTIRNFKYEKCDYLGKSSCIVDCDKMKLLGIITNLNKRNEYDFFLKSKNDLLVLTQNKLSVRFSVPSRLAFSHLLDKMEKKLEMVIYTDYQDNHYIIFREKIDTGSLFDNNFLEMFILMSVKEVHENKTLLIYITNFDFKANIPYFLKQILKESRLEIISYLRDYAMSVQDSDILKNLLEVFKEEARKYKKGAILDNENKLIDEFETNSDRSSLLDKYKLEDSISQRMLSNGKRLRLEDRFINYFRYPEGGVECRNYEELLAQEGLILDLMKRAGKQLIEGKDIVAISLPVRIFEPRSMVERITDLWGSGPHYINLACKTQDPVQRMKLIIAFCVSGLHMNLKQLKPFNPILGETYEGFWHDGTKIYVEHMSHHPPISVFYLQGHKNKFKFYGHYEYVAKLKSITGNSVDGQFKGPNTIEFSNGEKITFTYPFMSISGLLFGKRIIQWEKGMEFIDHFNNIRAFMNFTPQPHFYQKFKEPTDIFRGEMIYNGRVIHKIFGSPIDKLMFDDEVFWELETTDIIRSHQVESPLPSDCRYRNDLIALAKKDLELAESEKFRQETLQRTDKSLRLRYKM